MKKTTLVTATLLTVAFLFVCTGCAADKKQTPEATTDTTVSVSDEIDLSVFTEVETTSENLDVYREEVSRRVSSGEGFISDKAWEAISSNWDDTLYRHANYFTSFNDLYEETTKYYYPVVFREGNSLVMWYTDEYGSVLLKKVSGSWSGSNYVGNLHTDSEDESMVQEPDYTVTYNQESGKVNVWQFGEIDATYELPVSSVYCGFSEFEGYIFRSGTDVYALKSLETDTIVCIAHNVEYVIDADYYYGSDPWCQPLFLMTDGSIKAYIGWRGDEDVADSTTHLCDLQYEGSWDK